MPNIKSPTADPYSFVGSVLAERYKIEQLLGIGGVAAVYLARHLVTQRAVAVKILKPDQALAYPMLADYFSNEARATANLSHRNIVAVSDADTDRKGTVFLVMEYIEGRTLDNLLQGDLLPMDRIAELFDQICAGVDHAHSRGILHRDLKPSNIMVCKDDRDDDLAKILDFGIAKAITATAKFSAVVATTAYASPEQLSRGANVDSRSDIYSLGVILYEMMTNALPFEEETHEQLIYQKLNFILPPLKEIRPDVSSEVEDIIRRALSKEPGGRFQSASEMSRAFQRAVNLQSGVLIVECLDSESNEPLSGASVILNGKFAGQTSSTGAWTSNSLTPKQYLIEIERTGYKKKHTQFRVDSDIEAVVTLPLDREPTGEIIVRSNVVGAIVEIDNQKVGETDEHRVLHLESVESGIHKVRLTRWGYRTVEAEVNIKVGEITPIDLNLAAKTSAIGQLMTRFTGATFFQSKVLRNSILIILPLAIIASGGGWYFLNAKKPSVSKKVQTSLATNTNTENLGGTANPTPEVEAPVIPAVASPTEASPSPDVPSPSPTVAAPRTVEEKIKEGELCLRRRKWGCAVGYLSEAFKTRNLDSSLAENLGDAYAGAGQLDKAATQYNEAKKLGADNDQVYYKIGNIYLKTGNHQAAAGYCGEAAKRNIGNTAAGICLGKAYSNMGKNDDAIKALKKSLIANGNNAEMLYDLGILYNKKRNKKEAQDCVNRLLKVNEKLAEKLAIEMSMN